MDTSSSSSSMSRRNYEAFLSFRGDDTRLTIISHLYHALCQKGVYTFKDSEELELGDRRSELFDAIEGSCIAIVTFSENYARSKWCLDELQKIMERKEKGKLSVLPMFYRVSPGEVRLHEKDNGEKGCYQIAMEEMEEKYGKDSERVKRWRKALWQGGDLIGIPLDRRQDEGNAVREVVEKVLKLLNRVPLEVAKYPVGIGRYLKAMRPLLHIDPHVHDVYMLGILGQAGVGKTTISKAICNDIADSFDSWCFLPNVRDTTSRVFNGLAYLQEKLLRELLSEEKLTVSSVDAGKNLIKQRLRNKSVLVILDDVDESNQLDALAGNLNWFGKGSRIVITTRNNHVLTHRVQHVHEVKLLKKEEAISLFCLHAFGGTQEKINKDDALVDIFVKYAGALPLALVVLGAYLHGRSASEWAWKAKELAESPDVTINSVLKISFEGLENNHKDMFLDVACFFKGWNISYVEKILDSCGFATSLGIKTLIDLCLVTIVNGEIQMHDLLVVMGQDIVRGEYLKGNGMLSRIWLYEDFLDILLEDQERQAAVKAIVLNFSREEVAPFKYDAFKGFKNLRILIVRNGACPEKKSQLQLSRELRWLEWYGCSASAIEFDPSSKLVGLDLEDSKIRQIKGRMGFVELKDMNLSGCISLNALPDLSKSRKLEDLSLYGCENLTSIDEAIGSLENLVHLNLGSCSKLVKVPSSLRSKHLRTLDYSWCTKLYTLPTIKEELTFLQKLELSGTAVKELPNSFGNYVTLKELVIIGCVKLASIPSSIYKLQALEKLHVSECRKLSGFPRRPAGAATDILGFPNLVSLRISHSKLKDMEFLNDLTCFKTLKELDFSGNDFAHVPACIIKFKNLDALQLRGCKRLREVSELPKASTLSLTSCPRLKIFPSLHTFICQSPKSFRVDLSECLSLDSSYIDRSLPLEKVRGFVGRASIFIPGEEFPHWLNFQTSEYGSRYLVSLPRNMSEDDILGLALFVSFSDVMPLQEVREKHSWINSTVCRQVNVRIGGTHIFSYVDIGDGVVRTWFVYISRQPPREEGFNWSNLALEFLGLQSTNQVIRLKKWGMRLLCKRDQDDHRINVHKEENNKSDSSGSEYESALEYLCDTDDYESAQSDWNQHATSNESHRILHAENS